MAFFWQQKTSGAVRNDTLNWQFLLMDAKKSHLCAYASYCRRGAGWNPMDFLIVIFVIGVAKVEWLHCFSPSLKGSRIKKDFSGWNLHSTCFFQLNVAVVVNYLNFSIKNPYQQRHLTVKTTTKRSAQDLSIIGLLKRRNLRSKNEAIEIFEFSRPNC